MHRYGSGRAPGRRIGRICGFDKDPRAHVTHYVNAAKTTQEAGARATQPVPTRPRGMNGPSYDRKGPLTAPHRPARRLQAGRRRAPCRQRVPDLARTLQGEISGVGGP